MCPPLAASPRTWAVPQSRLVPGASPDAEAGGEPPREEERRREAAAGKEGHGARLCLSPTDRAELAN